MAAAVMAAAFFSRFRSAAAASSAWISASDLMFCGGSVCEFHLSLLSSCVCSSTISCCCSCSRRDCSWRASAARRSRSAFWISARLGPVTAVSAATEADHGATFVTGRGAGCCCCCCCFTSKFPPDWFTFPSSPFPPPPTATPSGPPFT
uniref:(northern house mosquito) hypothetical protein n=1 Tax=Culex pipiens TaxID=7175 RepID=A0A8D8MJ07_CULPI